MLSRRTFISATATSIAASSLTQPAAVAADESAHRQPVVDTHVHCFAGKDDAKFPYHSRGPYHPADAATPEQLLRCMDNAGIDFAVIVHPEPYHDDHRYLEHCLRVGGDRLKGVCLFFADEPHAAKNLAALVQRWPKQIVAARIHAYAPERLPPWDKPELRDLWQQAADLGLAMQLHFEPRYAPKFEPLVAEFSKSTVIVDHLGRPFQGTPDEYDAVVGWSRFPHAMVKLSAIPLVEEYPHRQIAPTITRLVEAFGSDRLIYGGGFSHNATGRSYRAERERLQTLLDKISATDQAKILGGTAARLFGFAK